MPPSLPSDPGGEEPPIDDFTDPHDDFRPPLPPEDRIWRHPSEVAAAARSQTTPQRAAARPSVATIAVSALIGATLSLGVVAALGGFDERVVERRVAVDVPVGEVDGTHRAVDLTSPSVAGMAVRSGDRWSMANAMILRSDGQLLTTAESVAGADEIEIHLASGEVVDAEVVGADPTTDVAVVRIDRDDLQPVVVGTSVGLGAGHEAMTIGLGSTSGWEPVLTTCVIRAVGQRAVAAGTTLHDVVVIDSEMSSDFAGGPVVDPRGVVIGMITAADPETAESGSAVIPIDHAVRVADEIIEYGRARHVWLGVGGHDLSPSEAEDLGLDGGAMISTVYPDSPAATSGIGPGDVIVAVDGTTIDSMSDLVVVLRTHEPGDSIDVEVANDRDTRTVSTRLADRGDR